MKNTILVSAATAFVTTVLVLFTVAMCKGHGCKSSCGAGHGGPHMEKRMHHGHGHGGHGGPAHGMCKGKKMKKCKSTCSGDENIEIEKKVIIKEVEEEN